jgi:hypothetical protein
MLRGFDSRFVCPSGTMRVTVLTRLLDQYVQWWQYGATRCLETLTDQPSLMKSLGFSLEWCLESKRFMDRMLEEMWRSLRLSPLEEVIRIHERLIILESRWMGLLEEGKGREGESGIQAILENLNSLKKAVSNAQRQLPPPSSD